MLELSKRWKHFAAMALLGDAVMTMVRPERNVAAWNMGPWPWRKLMQGLHDHPNVTRALGGVQAAAAIYWVVKQENRDKI